MIQDSMGICILSYNHPEITARCVRSVLTHVKASQVLLYHNGSQPQFVSSLKEQFPDIYHEVSKENFGYSGGANRTLKKAFEFWKWTLFLTNDTELLNLVDPSNLSPGLYAPMIWHRKQQSLDSWGGALHLPSANLRHLKSYKELLSQYERFYVPGTAFVIDQQTFMNSEGFDENLGTFWEDVDYSIRLTNAGVTVYPSQGIEILHLGGKTVHKDPHYTLFLFQRNRWIVTKRYLPRDMKLTFYYSWLEELFRITTKLKRQKRLEDLKRLRRAFWDGLRSRTSNPLDETHNSK